jgi:hypothetical protein
MHHQLRGRTLDLVGGIQVRVTGERAVVVPREQLYRRSVAAVAKVEHHVFGEGVRPVGVAGRLGEVKHLPHLLRRQLIGPGGDRMNGGHQITVCPTGPPLNLAELQRPFPAVHAGRVDAGR